MDNFGERLKNIKPYIPTKYNGEIRLDANESPFDLPKEIKEEIAQNITAQAFNRYPDPYAEELCKKFAEYYSLSPKNVIAGNGSDELISMIFSAILRPRSFVMFVEPDFSMYRIYAELNRQNPMVLKKKLGQAFDYMDALPTAKKADLIIFSNPCNPTSTCAYREDILRILHNTTAIIVADEAYMDFCGESVIDKINEEKRLIVLRTCSKAFGLAAARIGFAVANEEIIDLFRTAKSPYNISMLDQVAATTVLSHPDYLKKRTEEILMLREKLYTTLLPLLSGDMQMPKPQTNFVRITTCRAKEIYEALKTKNILIRMPYENLLRITVGTAEEIDAFIDAFKEVTK